MENIRTGLVIKGKMSDVKKGRADLHEAIASARGKSLDESPDTEDKRTKFILELQDQIEELYQSVSESTATWRLLRIFPTSKTINVEELSKLLDVLLRQINALRKNITATTNARDRLGSVNPEKANSGILKDVAFRINFSDDSDLSRLASRMSIWSFSSVLDMVMPESGVYQLLQLTEFDFNTWWYREDSPSEDSLVWGDLKRLCLRIVDIMDRVEELEQSNISVHEPLQKLVDDTKEVTENFVRLLIDHPAQEDFLSSVFTHITIAIFAMSKVVKGTESAIQSGIPLLQPIIDKIQELCQATAEQLRQESPNAAMNGVMVTDRDQRRGKDSALFETFENEAQVQSMLANLKRIFQRPKVRPIARLSKPFDEIKPLGLKDLQKLDLHPVPLSTQNPQRLGEGAFSAVYRYTSVDGEKAYAVKMPLHGQDDIDGKITRQVWNRIIREAERLVECAHTNVVRLHGYYEIPDLPFPALVMDEYEMSLEKLIANKGDIISVQQRLRILKHVASGLSHVHKKDCAHGDLRAANVLVRTKASGNDWFVALADFGVSSVADTHESLSVNTVQKTSVYWLAPEYFISPGQDIQPPADIYAFGCVFLEVLTGKRPYYYADSGALLLHELKRRRDLPARDDAFGKRKGHYSFIREACAYNPRERPSAEVLIERIDDLRERETLGDW